MHCWTLNHSYFDLCSFILFYNPEKVVVLLPFPINTSVNFINNCYRKCNICLYFTKHKKLLFSLTGNRTRQTPFTTEAGTDASGMRHPANRTAGRSQRDAEGDARERTLYEDYGKRKSSPHRWINRTKPKITGSNQRGVYYYYYYYLKSSSWSVPD